MTLKLKEQGWLFNPKTDFGIAKTLHIVIDKEKDVKYKYGKIRIESARYTQLQCVEGYDCSNEGNNIINISTDIADNVEIPFILTVNKADSLTTSTSFEPIMELLYSKDAKTNWGILTSSTFKVSSG